MPPYQIYKRRIADFCSEFGFVREDDFRYRKFRHYTDNLSPAEIEIELAKLCVLVSVRPFILSVPRSSSELTERCFVKFGRDHSKLKCETEDSTVGSKRFPNELQSMRSMLNTHICGCRTTQYTRHQSEWLFQNLWKPT